MSVRSVGRPIKSVENPSKPKTEEAEFLDLMSKRLRDALQGLDCVYAMADWKRTDWIAYVPQDGVDGTYDRKADREDKATAFLDGDHPPSALTDLISVCRGDHLPEQEGHAPRSQTGSSLYGSDVHALQQFRARVYGEETDYL